jgi:hypothetical protein
MSRAVPIALLALLVAGAGASLVQAQGLPRRAPAPPPVVELFTAQGCQACPQANAWAGRLASNGAAVVLTYPVDYWDYLGWRDTLAKPAFSARQKAYRAKLGLRDMYTPQFVVDGRSAVPGNDLMAVGRSVMRRGAAPPGPEVTLDRSGRRVIVSGGPDPQGGAEVWMVRYDPRDQAVAVAAGENRGKVVRQRNVVRELVRLGPWTGRARAYALPPPGAPGLRTTVLVQGLRRQGVLGVGR